MEKLKWYNLKNNRCPKCGGRLEQDRTGGLIHCKTIGGCDFRIKEEKMRSIVSSMVNKKIDNEYEYKESTARIEAGFE